MNINQLNQLLLVGCLILAMSLGELQPDSASASELESYNPQYNLCVGICVAQGIGAADDSKDFTMDLKKTCEEMCTIRNMNEILSPPKRNHFQKMKKFLKNKIKKSFKTKS